MDLSDAAEENRMAHAETNAGGSSTVVVGQMREMEIHATRMTAVMRPTLYKLQEVPAAIILNGGLIHDTFLSCLMMQRPLRIGITTGNLAVPAVEMELVVQSPLMTTIINLETTCSESFGGKALAELGSILMLMLTILSAM